jgi:hypothetical protein
LLLFSPSDCEIVVYVVLANKRRLLFTILCFMNAMVTASFASALPRILV